MHFPWSFRAVAELSQHTSLLTAVALYESRLAVGFQDGTVAILNVSTGKLLGKMKPTHRAVDCLVFSSNGATLAASSYIIADMNYNESDGSLDVWEAESLNQLCSIRTAGKVNWLRQKFRGDFLAQEVVFLHGASGGIAAIGWNTGSGQNRAVQLFDLPSGEWIRALAMKEVTPQVLCSPGRTRSIFAAGTRTDKKRRTSVVELMTWTDSTIEPGKVVTVQSPIPCRLRDLLWDSKGERFVLSGKATDPPGDETAFVAAINNAAGDLAWWTTVPRSIHGKATLSESRRSVYIPGVNNEIIVLDLETGSLTSRTPVSDATHISWIFNCERQDSLAVIGWSRERENFLTYVNVSELQDQ